MGKYHRLRTQKMCKTFVVCNLRWVFATLPHIYTGQMDKIGIFALTSADLLFLDCCRNLILQLLTYILSACSAHHRSKNLRGCLDQSYKTCSQHFPQNISCTGDLMVAICPSCYNPKLLLLEKCRYSTRIVRFQVFWFCQLMPCLAGRMAGQKQQWWVWILNKNFSYFYL